VIGDAVLSVWKPHEPEMFGRRQVNVDVFNDLEQQRYSMTAYRVGWCLTALSAQKRLYYAIGE